ncbi:MAG: glycoside hydrolase family 28 protein [Bacteroidota bacterium]|nr:glycoside hydrolase family 28 protein [Bacteroidota bacterium]
MKISFYKKINFAACTTIFLITQFVFVSKINAQEKDIAWYTKNAPFQMPIVTVPAFPDRSFSITNYGAASDGQTLNTNAFEKTIAACAAAGGGKVIVPAGLWLTGPIQLQSNIDLHVERGALIIFTKDHSQYPMIKSSKTGSNYVPASPIYGYDLKNIAITGEGIIDGAGDSWRPVKKIKVSASQWKEFTSSGGAVSKDGSLWWPTKQAMEGEDFLKELKEKNVKPSAEGYLPARDFLRPYMLYLVNCQNILIENVTLRNSPKFVFYPNNCFNLTIRYVNIFNEYAAQNGDGIDISASKNVVIYKCNVSVGDDGICMKSSGKNDNTDKANLENILIAGCNVYHAHGGFVIGSNTDGGMKNIFVSDCNFVGTDVGIRVKSNAGRGGLVRDIFISNIFMSDIVNDAISFDTYYEDVPAGTAKTTSTAVRDKTPEFRDFYISNVFCNGAKTAISITGLPEMPVHKVFFENVVISSQNGFVATDAEDIDLKNVNIIVQKQPVFVLKNVKNLNK